MEKEKDKSKKKEILMIVVVVVLAFGLTAGGIFYLTKFLMGGSSTPPASQQQTPVPPDDVVRFSVDNNTGNVAIPAPTPPPVQPATPPPAPPATPAPMPAVTPPAPPPAAATPPPVPQKQSAEVVIPVKSPTKGKYQLQLFAFQSMNKATAEAKKYAHDYSDIYIMQVDLGSKGVWYRVRCCSVDTRDEAAAVKSRMQSKYKIVPDIVKAD